MTNNKQDTFNTLHTAYDSDFFSIVEKPINKLLFVHSKKQESIITVQEMLLLLHNLNLTLC